MDEARDKFHSDDFKKQRNLNFRHKYQEGLIFGFLIGFLVACLIMTIFK